MIPYLRSQVLEPSAGDLVGRGADQDVEAFERIDEALDARLVGYVEFDRASTADRMARDAFGGQAVNDRGADTAAATGDDRDLAG